MQIEIWSDVVCPWCAVGKAHLDTALQGFSQAEEVEIRWRSFELDPGAPAVREGTYVEQLARKYLTSDEQATAMIAQMTGAAAAAGVEFHLDRARPGNSFDAHRVVQLAADRGRQHEMKTRLLRAYVCEGALIGDHETLVGLATEVGLAPDEVRAVLGSEEYAEAVRADEQLACDREITAVPTFVIDGRFVVPGAQQPDVLLQALERARALTHPPVPVAGRDRSR